MQLIGLAGQAAVPGHAGLDARVVRGVQPDDAPAPAEPGDADRSGVGAAVGSAPAQRGVEVAHHLGVRHLAHHLLDDVLDVGDPGDVALAREQLRRDGEIADLGQPPADVPDVLVHAEDLLHHDHHRERPAGLRERMVGRDRAVARRQLDLARRSGPWCRW